MAAKYAEYFSPGIRTPLPNEYPGYDIKASDGEAIALELWKK